MLMKKAVVIALAVAILGALGLYANGKTPVSGLASGSASSSSFSNQSAVQGTSTQASTTSTPTSTTSSSSAYKDGTFNGSAADTPYGTVQIAVVISGGKITDVHFLQMPSDQGHSREVTRIAGPLLKQTTLDKQSSNIDFVSGATSTTFGYQESLQAALDKAKAS
jgi:uncharacterized protein with FMN-binding domain